jgi:hypothetical protein
LRERVLARKDAEVNQEILRVDSEGVEEKDRRDLKDQKDGKLPTRYIRIIHVEGAVAGFRNDGC